MRLYTSRPKIPKRIRHDAFSVRQLSSYSFASGGVISKDLILGIAESCAKTGQFAVNRNVENGATLFLPVTSPNADRF